MRFARIIAASSFLLSLVAASVVSQAQQAGRSDPVLLPAPRRIERLDGAQATAGVFRALGVTATVGRPLIADDERAGADPVLVLSHRLWQSRFGGDPSVVGRQVDLDGRSRRIVGVLGMNMPAKVMRSRVLVESCTPWDEALATARADG